MTLNIIIIAQIISDMKIMFLSMNEFPSNSEHFLLQLKRSWPRPCHELNLRFF